MAHKALDTEGGKLIEVYWQSTYLYSLSDLFKVSPVYTDTLSLSGKFASTVSQNCLWGTHYDMSAVKNIEFEVDFAPLYI
jgi:hypothetical protein